MSIDGGDANVNEQAESACANEKLEPSHHPSSIRKCNELSIGWTCGACLAVGNHYGRAGGWQIAS